MADDETTPSGQPPWVRPSDTPTFVPPAAPPTDPAALRAMLTPAVPERADPGAGGPAGPTGGPGDGGPPSPFPPATIAIEDDEDERPQPAIASLGAALGGILVVLGLFALLSSSDVAQERGNIIALSLLFAIVGAGVTWLTRSQRAVAGGVAISALAVIPLFNALFHDPKDVVKSFSDPGSYRNAQLAVLACLALVWLLSYAVGPGKRHGLFLGAGLIALWLIPMTYFSLSAVQDTVSSFNQVTSFTTSGTGTTTFGDGSSSSSDPFDLGGDGGSSNGGDLFGGGGDQDHLPLKLGLTSLVFGAAFLAVGGWLDNDLRPRMATPFFASAAIVLWQAIGNLEPDLKVGGANTIALILGCVAIWLGARGGRRFTSWLGVLASAFAIATLADHALDSKPGSIGVLLTFLGVIVLGGFAFIERAGAIGGAARPHPPAPADPTPPAGPPMAPAAPSAPAMPPAPPGPPGAGGPMGPGAF